MAHASTDERIRGYEKLLQSAPDDSQFQIGLVSAYLQKLRETADPAYLDRASAIVSRMLEKDGGNFAALRFQNEIDLQRHEFKAVAERAGSMAKYNPSDAGNWGNLGDALMDLGEYEQAGKAYRRMLSLRPNLDSYNRLAYWRFVTGDGLGAIALMRSAVEAGDAVPENTAWCLAELGDMYFKLGKVPEAASAYTRALDLFPGLHRAYAGLGRVEASLGHKENAIKQYERAQSIVPLVEYDAALEDLYTAEGQKDRALSEQELIDTVKNLCKIANEKTNRNLALVLADHNRDLPLALSLIEAEIPVRGDVYTYDAFSWVLLKNNRLPEAVAASAQALKLGTPEPLFYYHASKIAAAAGNMAAARQYSEKLASLNPHFDFAKADIALASIRSE
ncbi:MAG: tetratricopeptide repeat protein [Acidobacteriaceae bacterium]|nr:tetratricopeptide repeat protein [Acidobacteriaceae bacterium]